MNRKMLIVLDGSKLAEIVFPFAKELAGRLCMDAELLHVYPARAESFVPTYRLYIDRVANQFLQEAQAVQQSLGVCGEIHARGELVEGYHADEILKFADTHQIDLIVMSSHGRSGAKRWTIGSVADKILRAAKVPVWLVHVDMDQTVLYDNWPSRTLLIPLTESEVSSITLPFALEIAGQKGANFNVVLMEVVEPPTTPSYYTPEFAGVSVNWGQFVEEETTRARKMALEHLQVVEEKFKKQGIPVKSVVMTGKAAEEIANFGHNNPSAIIIMATHGRKGFSRLVYGSVTEHVLFGVTNPVIVVRPQ
ncbi:MAG TPA: universal stress protein [Dehalococcoidales bacterium]|nr:universal stress protein [Dehalococcoidales bacterium]